VNIRSLCYLWLLFFLFSTACGNDVAYPTSISGQALLGEGKAATGHVIYVTGIREKVCPPIVYCNEQEAVSSDSVLTSYEGRFELSLPADPEIDYYSVRMKGVLPGANACFTYSEIVYPGYQARDIILRLYCDE
jgi:hypothetical protein